MHFQRSTPRTSVGLVAALALLVSMFVWIPPAGAAPYEPDDPVQNPDLEAVCGLDVLMILDESGSIDQSDATDNVIDAYTTFVSALNNTGSRVGVVEFSQVARLPIDEYTTVTDNTLANQFLDLATGSLEHPRFDPSQDRVTIDPCLGELTS